MGTLPGTLICGHHLGHIVGSSICIYVVVLRAHSMISSGEGLASPLLLSYGDEGPLCRRNSHKSWTFDYLKGHRNANMANMRRQ